MIKYLINRTISGYLYILLQDVLVNHYNLHLWHLFANLLTIIVVMDIMIFKKIIKNNKQNKSNNKIL